MRRLKAGFVLLPLMTVLVCTGCWDRTEVNDIAIVITMAFDKDEDGLYRMSVQVPLAGQLGGPGGGGGGSGGGDKSYYVDSEVGKTIREASNRLQRRMARRLFYAHHRVVIMGEELAKEGISPVSDILSRFPENRLTAYMLVAKGEGRALLEAEPKFERYSGEAMREIIKTYTFPMNAKEISYRLTQPGSDPILPIMGIAETQSSDKSKEVQFMGYAQFRKDKMVDVFPKKAVNGLSWLYADFYPYNTVQELDQQGRVNVFFENGDVQMTPILKGDRILFRIKVNTQASIQENISNINFEDESNVRDLESKLRKNIRNTLKQTVNQMKKRSADSIGLGLMVYRYYPDQWQEKFEEKWRDRLKDIEFTYDISAHIVDTGQTSTNITQGREDSE